MFKFSIPVPSGEDGLCHECPGCPVSLSGNEHVGRRHVWLEHISRLGYAPQQDGNTYWCTPFICSGPQCYSLITDPISEWAQKKFQEIFFFYKDVTLNRDKSLSVNIYSVPLKCLSALGASAVTWLMINLSVFFRLSCVNISCCELLVLPPSKS